MKQTKTDKISVFKLQGNTALMVSYVEERLAFVLLFFSNSFWMMLFPFSFDRILANCATGFPINITRNNRNKTRISSDLMDVTTALSEVKRSV